MSRAATSASDSDDGPALLNRQRRVRVPAAALRVFLAELREEAAGGRPFSLCLVSDAAMRRYNRDYRGHDCTTDVLSFAGESQEFAGDLLVSADTAQRQARLLHHSVETEIKVLALHGLLHLLGYGHERAGERGRMARAEKRWRRRFGLPGGLIERAESSPRMKTDGEKNFTRRH